MPYEIDETHDPSLKSWVESANDPNTDFPIQNLPLSVWDVTNVGAQGEHVLVPIGDMYLDLDELSEAGLLDSSLFMAFHGVSRDDGIASMHAVARASADARTALRRRISELLRSDCVELRDNAEARETCLIPAETVHEDGIPVTIESRDYTDFYASLFHATNVGSMFRPDNPLLPNYKHIPIGYHGRASSVVASGTPVRRPVGQQAPTEEGGLPGFGPCKLLDYELEMGAIIARGNALGESISIEDAEDHILGLCLLNDWSARDLQKWEYQPLGPFLAKNFATTVSPYIVTMEALAPFRAPAQERAPGDPQPLPYMDSDHNRTHGNFDITLEVHLSSAKMREQGMDPIRLSRGNFKDMYWTVAQMVTHHSVNGCNLQPGDLLGSGTVSGPTRDSRGAMIELTWDGDPFSEPPVLVPGTQRTPIKLPTGEERKFLADGDEVILQGYCEREGFRRIGFGECRGIIQPARNI